MGSFMSDHQRWLLERMGATVYVMMDNDAAGQVALHGHPATSEHPEFPGIAKKLSKSLEVKIVQYNPEKKQPSDLSQNEVVAALNSAKDYHLWTIEGTANGIR
jgi:DNA primase